MPVQTWNNLSFQIIGTGSLTNNPTIQNFYDSGQQASINHSRHDSPPSYRTGGPWWLSKTDITCEFPHVIKKNGAGTATLYSGAAGPRHFGTTPSIQPLSSDSNMDARGATAMSRVLPTNPHAGLVNSFAELLRDGVPVAPGSQTWKEQTFRAKQAGSEYLNVEFGWKPLIADIRKLSESVKSGNQKLAEFRNGSGKLIRRRFDYPATTTTTVSNGYQFGFPTDAGIRWTGSTVVRVTTEEWFEGAFTYYVPEGDDIISKLQRVEAEANHLFGTRLTPDVVWNASPWSWAADWFSNAGAVIRNASALQGDGLTLWYGYHMLSQVVDIRTDAVSDAVNGKKYTGSYRTVHSTKQRRPANPYGFGLNGMATTLRQKAIVAAIAASRSGSKAK